MSNDIDGVPAGEFPNASFDDLEFAYHEVTVKGGIRYAMHEFPHAAGGEPEKMGRKPYTVSFRAIFHDIPKSDFALKYPDAYPANMRILREKFEVQLTAWLVIPTVGKIKAVAVDWTQRFDVRSPTGESFDIEFVEDQESTFLTSSVATVAGAAVAIADAGDAAFAAAALLADKSKNAVGFFQALNDALTLVQGALGQADAFSNVLAGKIEGVINLISAADSSLDELQNPANHALINALKDLQLSLVQVNADILQTQQRVLIYTTPRKMTIGQVASALYGNAEKGSDILLLNTIEDAFAIPAGTALKWLSAT